MLSQTALLETVLELPPAELKAVGLLRLHRPAPGRFFPHAAPIADSELIAATIQLMDYGERCTDAIKKLRHVRPVPLTVLSVLEYSI